MQKNNYDKEFGSQKEFILRIIKSCIYYDLGETMSLGVIERLTKKRISVKTFYNYKKILYKESKIYETKLNHANWVTRDIVIKSNLLFLHEDSLTKQFQVDKWICKEYPEIPKKYRKKMKDYGQKEIDLIIRNQDKLMDVIRKHDEKELALKKLPKNATIKKEQIKCGNKRCSKCPHGPYYYAYWKNKSVKKLMKKYIGSELPHNFTFQNLKFNSMINKVT